MRISVVMMILLALCGCGVEQQLTTIQEEPDVEFKITEWLEKHGIDPTDVGTVEWYVNGLLERERDHL